MNSNELKLLQSLPLNIKVAKTKLRIREFVDYFGVNNVYVSFSGGKDSTVLLDICRELYPDIKAIFVDTGLEYPELKEHIKSFSNVDILRPKLTFKQVLEKYGYPVVSKEQSRYIYDIRHSTEKMRAKRLSKDTQFRLSDKYFYLLDAPFEISNRCCDIMKKNPVTSYERRTGRKPIIGTLAEESSLRKRQYIKNGCNSFNSKRQHSTPMGFWTEQDVLRYILEKNLKIASVYGSIIEKDGILSCSGVKRTGCVFCMYGIQTEQGENRFQKLYKTHPKLHSYCMNVLGFKKVCDFMNIKYK